MPFPIVQRRSYALPEVNRREVLRYARAGNSPDASTRALLEEVIEESSLLTGRICYVECPVQITQAKISLGILEVVSADLSKCLSGCTHGVLFCGTLGLELDRIIARAGRLAPAKGLFLQALGAERVEALCDCFCHDMATTMAPRGLFPRPRYSPGYGDLPLSFQRPLLEAVDASRQIGVGLNESLLMSPSKSVSAIIGFGPTAGENITADCIDCTAGKDCPFSRR